ncbi:MAG: hypothetical protein FWC78_07060 [Defluviitaleaceae bacterium]|nr:hypothetical protein [Defluviitaleaceae bacterium]
MVQFLVGFKGEGKTRKLIEMANAEATQTDGSLVFIDDDKRHIHDIHRDIRFVDTGKASLSSCRGLAYFIWGMLTQNADIKHIYVDGLPNIVREELSHEALTKFRTNLEALSEEFHVDITFSMHYDREKLPESIKEVLV